MLNIGGTKKNNVEVSFALLCSEEATSKLKKHQVKQQIFART